MKENVCVTSFIFGKRYQEYLPLLLYSLKRAYPGYTPIIFLHDNLESSVEKKLEGIEENFIIKENKFRDINPLRFCQGKALRWVLRDKLLKSYDYTYFIDSDIIYCREPIPLHQQHISHLELLNLPFSNTTRKKINKNRSFRTIGKRVKEYGKEGLERSLYNLLRGTVVENRLSGLHFIKTKEYFEQVEEAQKKYLEILSSTRDYLKHFQGLTDESVLYRVCEESGFDLSKLGEFSASEECINFNSFDRRSFRPHHGIHLGIFRNHYKKGIINEEVSLSNTYKFYVKEIMKYLEDPVFVKIIKESKPFVQNQVHDMLKYYSIHKLLK